MASPAWVTRARVRSDALSFADNSLAEPNLCSAIWREIPQQVIEMPVQLLVSVGDNADGSYDVNAAGDAPPLGKLLFQFALPAGFTGATWSFAAKGSGTIAFQMLDAAGTPVGGTLGLLGLSGLFQPVTVPATLAADTLFQLAIYVNDTATGSTAQARPTIGAMRLAPTGAGTGVFAAPFTRAGFSPSAWTRHRALNPRFPTLDPDAAPLAYP